MLLAQIQFELSKHNFVMVFQKEIQKRHVKHEKSFNYQHKNDTQL